MLSRVDLTLDCADPARLAEFWKAAAGYVDEPPPPPFATREEWLAQFDDEFDDGMGAAWLHDPTGIAPRLCILQVPEPKIAKNRLHLDLRVSGDGTPDEKWAQVTAEVARLQAAGGQVLHTFEGHHVVMADPEGNEFCVA
jgi:catechol 2,3-dioxygenase-like lactoylglutathione lyase family enzyme